MMKLLITILYMIFVCTIAIDISSFVPVCGRRNPNLNECVKNSFNFLRPKLIKGIPELHVPSISPLILEYALPLKNLNGLNANITDIKVYNVSTYEIKNMNVNLENKKIETLLYFNKLKLTANYELSARILIQIEGKGSVTLNLDDAELKCSLGYTLKDKKDTKQFYFTSASVKLNMKDFQTQFQSSIQNTSSSLIFNDAIDEVLNSNHREIAASVIPSFEKALATEILTIGNNLAGTATYDEIFPDHE